MAAKKITSIFSFLLIFLFLTIFLPLIGAQRDPATIAECRAGSPIQAILTQLYMYGESGRNFPETWRDLRLYCSQSNRLIREYLLYERRCLPRGGAITRNMEVARIFAAIKENIDQTCRRLNRNDAQERILAFTPCANAMKPEQQLCNRNASLYVADSIAFGIVGEERKAYLCCNVNRVMECMRDAMMRGPADRRCGAQAADRITQFVSPDQAAILHTHCAAHLEVGSPDFRRSFQPRGNSVCEQLVREAPSQTQTLSNNWQFDWLVAVQGPDVVAPPLSPTQTAALAPGQARNRVRPTRPTRTPRPQPMTMNPMIRRRSRFTTPVPQFDF